MNRYAALGLAEAARGGRRILVVSGQHRWSSHALDDFTGLADDARTIRANGRYRIEFPSGGWVRFTAPTGHPTERGLAFDTVYLDAEVADDHDLVTRYQLCVRASLSGEVVRA